MQLIAIYKKLKEAKKEFEIIYVCLDNDEEEWKEYFASMPWISLPYSDTRKKTLCKALELWLGLHPVNRWCHGQLYK